MSRPNRRLWTLSKVGFLNFVFLNIHELIQWIVAAAQAITLLYRSSTKASKRHFDAGYAAALDDLLHVIQHGLSAGPDINISGAHVQSEHEGVEEGMTIGRVMDWIEARQEGLRVATALGEEEEEDDRERGAVPRAEPSNNSSHHKNTRELEGKRISRSTQVCSNFFGMYRGCGNMY